MLIYFLICIAAFVIITLGMVWYARFMFTKIYGETRTEIDSITESGAAPPEWEEHLVKRLSKCKGEKEKKAVLEKHKKFVEKRIGDFILFMKNTSLVSSEAERGVYLERLESFRREYAAAPDGFAADVENRGAAK